MADTKVQALQDAVELENAKNKKLVDQSESRKIDLEIKGASRDPKITVNGTTVTVDFSSPVGNVPMDVKL